ncbi:MAG: TetR/AcrR family transcriptional regulator [Janthinobacterium lividum]
MARHGDVRQKILDAAEQRLWHYGFKKTTIDEIASDAGVGKGTVYLYFDGKEEIGLAIVAEYKKRNLKELEIIAQNTQKSPVEKLTEMLQYSVLRAYQSCQEAPAMQEMIVAIKPHIRIHLQPQMEQEYRLLASILEEGNKQGIFDVPDTLSAARTLKMMTHGFLPPYPSVSQPEQMASEIADMVALTVRGLRKQ